jgi:hypothetical protein
VLVIAPMKHAPDGVCWIIGGLNIADAAFVPKEMVNVET